MPSFSSSPSPSASETTAPLSRKPRVTWQTIGTVVQLLCTALSIFTWQLGLWPVTILLWSPIVWLNHAALARLHEAAHGTLVKHRLLNELHGIAIGTLALIPLSVYRYVHARHHAHLGNERDPEFWPYNTPSASRLVRVIYAWTELIAGYVFTTVLYSVRTLRSWPIVPPSQRRRITLEWMLIITVWTLAITIAHEQGWWPEFLVGFLIPAWLTGMFQTLRKFTEHLGMHGDTIMSMTRTVSYKGVIGKAASLSQMHVDHHGTHHRHARIPYYDLPDATPRVYSDGNEMYLFPTHFAAMRDMLPHLLDPKLGPQWVKKTSV